MLVFIATIAHPVQCFFILHVVKEANDDSAEEKRAEVDATDYLKEILICQETLLEAFIQKVWMVEHDIINGPYCAELSL